MEQDTKKCFRCSHLDRFYTKELKKFRRTEYGWCYIKQEIVNVQGGCEQCRFKRSRRFSQRVLCATLNELLTEINEVRNIIEDNCNENDSDKAL